MRGTKYSGMREGRESFLNLKTRHNFLLWSYMVIEQSLFSKFKCNFSLIKINKNRYEKLVPKWYSMALGSAVGLNRLFLMANFIEPQLNWNELDEQTMSRQVRFISSCKK